MDSMDRLSNSSDGSFDMVGSANDPMNNVGLQYVSNGRTKKKDKRKKNKRSSSSRGFADGSGMNGSSARRTSSSARSQSPPKSASMNNHASVPNFGSQYVLPPKPEEQVSLVSSDNLDPSDPLAGVASENFQDEFEDEMDEIEMDQRHNFNNFGQKSDLHARGKKRACCTTYLIPALIGILFVLGIVAAILYLTGVGKNASGDGKPSQSVAPPVDTLSLLCHDANPGPNSKLPDLCKDKCLEAECCWNPGGQYSCSSSTKKYCPQYQVECNPWKDQLLGHTVGSNEAQDDEMVVPPLPAGLQTECAPNFSELNKDCKQGCAAAACCWNKYSTTICTSKSVHYCLNYNEMCSFLNDHIDSNGEYIPDATVDSSSLETPAPNGPDSDGDGVSDQDEQNVHGTDANNADTDGDGLTDGQEVVLDTNPNNADTDNDGLSDGEEVTEIGTNPLDADTDNDGIPDAQEAKWPWPDAPDGLSVYCDPAEMEEISLHICEDKCDQAECCWKEGVESCVDKYAPEACNDYTKNCAILNKLNTAPGNTHDTTSETPPPATQESNDNSLPEAPADLATTCSKDKITNNDNGGEALIQCEQTCLKASCCWQSNAASPCKDNERCAAYAPCSMFDSLFDKPSDYDPNADTLAPIKVSEVPAAPDQMVSDCNPEKLKTSVEGGKFIVQCEKQCLMGACCWKENHPTHCPDAPECSAYMAPCGTSLVNALIALEGGHQTVGENPATPAPTPLPTPLPTDAPQTDARPVETNVPDAPTNIGMMCNPDVLKLDVSDGSFIIECEKECLKAACCWKENHGTMCPDAPQCDEYLVPCGQHLAPVLAQMEGGTAQISDALVNPPSDLNIRCSADNINTNGNGQCEDACSKAECCWKVGAATTECDTNPICNEYKPCETLNAQSAPAAGGDNGNAPPSPPEDLSETCAATSLLDLTGLELCKVACEKADCCWLDDTDPNTCTTASECRTYETECQLMRNMVAASLGGNTRRMLRQR